MRNIFAKGTGLCDWKVRLADPEKHWKRGRSAFETAVSWETASATERGLPTEVAELFDAHDSLRGAKVLFAVPEHKVKLEGRGKDSQTDVWVLLRAPQGLISMAVEGKAGENFGDTIQKWLKLPSENRYERLRGLCKTLGISDEVPEDLRYQLLHRTASALLEARRCGASQAILLVQSFSKSERAFGDFQHFATHLGSPAERGRLTLARTIDGIALSLGWIDSPPCTDNQIARVLA